MNRNILSVVFLFMMACSSSNSQKDDEALKGKLPASLINNPRSLNQADSAKVNELGKLVFKDTIHDFGVLTEGEVVQYEFTFTNQGKRDIIINEAKASCGCTVADYPGRPFKQGESDKIKVSFDSKGKPGMNEKIVSVITNGNPSVYNLLIQAQVVQK
ncbi:MAG: DUF1573 domain-containing protein [Chitinophagaceae bacterium]|nr:DUF1573 domain-containing protein [Chitinophagaceae bacterium]